MAQRNHLGRPGRGAITPWGRAPWRGFAVGWSVAGRVACQTQLSEMMPIWHKQTPAGVYDAEHAENGRWAWFWTSPGGATFDSAAIYATKEAALYAARAWVKRRYKG